MNWTYVAYLAALIAVCGGTAVVLVRAYLARHPAPEHSDGGSNG